MPDGALTPPPSPSFAHWLVANARLRAMKVDETFDVIEMEDVDEVIMTYPAVCMVEEQRVEKLALVNERNGMRRVLDEKYYGGAMDELVLEVLDLEIYLIEMEQPRLGDKLLGLNNDMVDCGEDEEGQEQFAKLDAEMSALSWRKEYRGTTLLQEKMQKRETLVRAIEAKEKAKAEKERKEREEEEDERRRKEEKKRIGRMSMGELVGEEKKAGGEEDEEDEEGGGFRVQVSDSDEGDSDEEGSDEDEDEDEDDEEGHEDSDEAFGSDEED